MKSFLLAIPVSIALFGGFVSPSFAQGTTCNMKCQINEDCGTGYRCYVGVCRNSTCPSSPSCGCGVSATATPSATLRTTVTSTATPSAQTVVATPSAVAKTPTTGPRETAGLALGLFVVGMAVYAKEYRSIRGK